MKKKFHIVLFTLLSLVSNLAQTSYAQTFGDKGTVNTAVNYEIESIKVDNTSNPPRIVITGKDGEFYVKEMTGAEWLETIGELGSSVWEI
jgi:hypothetical protein